MSVVTGVVLQCSVAEEFIERDEHEPDVVPVLDDLDNWLRDRGFQPLHRVGREASKGKHPQIHIACGGYNYFPDAEFKAFFLSRDWQSPHQAVLMLTHEDLPTDISTAVAPAATGQGEK